MPGDVVVSAYVGLDRKAEKLARDAVVHISGIQQRLVTDIAEIGNTLNRVKEAVGHGRFLPWIEAEFNWTERTAQNYMSVAERFGSNAKCLSHLPLAMVYKLAAPTTPDELRNEVVAKLESGEPVKPSDIADELHEVAQAAKRDREEAKKLARKLARKSPEDRARAEANLERQRARAAAVAVERQEERNRLEVNRKAAADLIVSDLAPDKLARLLELLKDAHSVNRVELIEAQDRKG